MTRQRYDVAVIGSGMMGSAAALELARRGMRTVLLEQFSLGHAQGSSHGDARIFRLSYEHVDYVRMAQESLVGWRRLESESGEQLLRRTGGVDLGPEEAWRPNLDALREAGAAAEVVDPEQLRRLAPGLSGTGGPSALWQPDAGSLRADRCLLTLRRLAEHHRAEVREHWRVLSVSDNRDHVAIRAEREEVLANTCVVAAGPWVNGLLTPLGIELPLRVSLQTVAYLTGAEPTPPVLIAWGTDPPLYALPAPGGLLKASFHGSPHECDPRDPERPPDRERPNDVVRQLEPLLVSSPTVSRLETCIYTNTPDEDYVLDRRGRVVVASCCSGHGFKMAPVLGRLAADLVEGAKPQPRFRLARFREVARA